MWKNEAEQNGRTDFVDESAGKALKTTWGIMVTLWSTALSSD